MRLWTYLLPAGLWLWFVRRNCERMPLPPGGEGVFTGRELIYFVPKKPLSK